jgi:hypothetical protein
MNITIDDDVRAVVEFMQSSIPAARLCSVADGLHALAPLLWGHVAREEVKTIALVASPISPDGRHKLPSSSEPHLAH